MTKPQPLGPNPQGLMMFDSAYAEENKAVLAGMLGFFGTYSVNAADRVLTSVVQLDYGVDKQLVKVSKRR